MDAFLACAILFIGFSVALTILAGVSLGTFLRVAVYQDFRFAGFSENPNQLAFALLPLLWVAVRGIRRRRGLLGMLSYAALVCIVSAGVATRSDALILAWTVAGCGYVASRVWLHLLRSRLRPGMYVLMIAVVPALLITFTANWGGRLASSAMAAVEGTYSEGEQGSDRLSLWMNASSVVERWPVQGLGPGAHSGILQPFEGLEAHNSFLDLASMAGVPAAIVLVVLVIVALSGVLIRREYELGAALISMLIFINFHFMLRQPIFWLFVASTMIIGWPSKEDPRTVNLELHPPASS
jgi:hypothetical protein